MKVLVTGGAGYIGSHAAHQLVDQGHQVVVLDNLYSGNKWAVPEKAQFFEGNIADEALVEKILAQTRPDAVMHFAAHIEVEESVKNPLKYYENNFIGSTRFIKKVVEAGIRRFIFSSTAAVYGNPEQNPVAEGAAIQPLSPYGASKSMTERVLMDLATQNKIEPIIFRYFNVAGARKDLKIGQATPRATHLIKVAAEAATGKRPQMAIFGTDYPTPDGTALRDYIHVEDLVAAHLLGLTYKMQGPVEIFNLGYGKAFSVKEVVDVMKRVSEVDFKVVLEGRRAGDANAIVANPKRAQETLAWKAQYNDINVICKTAFDWEKKLGSL